jgi:DNA polymerase elongation subunit (family B)
MIFAKKRYIGNLYENDVDKFDLKSMGVVLKRRDNAKILKHIYGGIINIILQDKDIKKSLEFLDAELQKLVNGEYDWDNFIISKKINASYKKPESIAHKVLADRVNKRKNGNIFNSGDRIEYIFIKNDKAKLQGERIETKEYILENNLKPDYNYYIVNQLMNPITDIYKLCYFNIPNNDKDIDYWENERKILQADKKNESDEDVDKIILKLKEKHIQSLLFGKYL